MEYDEFQEGVLELAAGGTRITKGNVALRLKVAPDRVGALLDRMAREGRLELDIDERSGEIYFEVRKGHRAAATSSGGARRAADAALATVGKALGGGADLAGKLGVSGVAALAKATSAGGVVAEDQRRKIGLGILLGGLLPGFGLFYSAPWPIAVGASLAFTLGFKLLSLIPLFSSMLLIPFVVVCAIASGVLGGLYTWQFNQTGKRTALGDEPVSPKQLLKRLRGRSE